MAVLKDILGISDALRQGLINFSEVPFDKILDAVSMLYLQAGDSENYYTTAFGQLLVDAVETQNAETASLILDLMAHNLSMLMTGENVRRNLTYSNYRLKTEVNYRINCEKIIRYYETHTLTDIVPFEGKGVVYSAITGEYDDVKEPDIVNPDFDYILFTDNENIKSDIWDVRRIDNPEGLDEVRLARRIKIMGHEYLPGYDFSIWIDGKMQIIGDIKEYIQKYRQREPMLLFSHYINDCAYMEAETCLAMNKDSAEIMKKQMDRYRREGYPEKNGMVDSCVLIRDLRNDKLKRVMETWWNEVKEGSRRDQLSFNYACWKEDFMYDTSALYVYGNDYVRSHNHK